MLGAPRVEWLYVLYTLDNLLYQSTTCLSTYLQKIADPEDLMPTLSMGVSVNHIAAVLVPLIGGYLWSRFAYPVNILRRRGAGRDIRDPGDQDAGPQTNSAIREATMSVPRVVVIGGGAAGMLAAGRAAQCGARVVVLEKGPKLARKLESRERAGRNITNTADLGEFIEAFAPNGKFLYGAFSRFFRDDLIGLLREMGVETKVERGGRVFPASDRASDVADALERWMEQRGVSVKLNATVKSLDIAPPDDAHERPRVVGVNLYGGRMDAGAVIVATGGASYPKTGSTGDGYAMAREAGHTIIPPKPALSAIITREDWVGEAPGAVSQERRGDAAVKEPGSEKPRRVASEFGEMLFTHNGVSGPIILTLSRQAGKLLGSGEVIISIDLKPALTPEQLHARLIRDFRQTRHFGNYLRELLPRLLAEAFPELVDIDPSKPVNSVTAVERARLVELLKDFRVTAARLAPLDEAIVTQGGVSITEIDPRTMVSKLADGLFFAGEVIDIDAETGGFNLQAAFSTGYVAGESAAGYWGVESGK